MLHAICPTCKVLLHQASKLAEHLRLEATEPTGTTGISRNSGSLKYIVSCFKKY